MELEPPVAAIALEFLIQIAVVALVQPHGIALGMARRCQAQQHVARGTDGAPDPHKLLPDKRSAPLNANAVTGIAVAAFWSETIAGRCQRTCVACHLRRKNDKVRKQNSPMHHHISSLSSCQKYPSSQ
jgi:hypothetical protein